VLAVRTTSPESELQAAHADWIVDDLSKLVLGSADQRVIVLAI
jgi:hypothetical protein